MSRRDPEPRSWALPSAARTAQLGVGTASAAGPGAVCVPGARLRGGVCGVWCVAVHFVLSGLWRYGIAGVVQGRWCWGNGVVGQAGCCWARIVWYVLNGRFVTGLYCLRGVGWCGIVGILRVCAVCIVGCCLYRRVLSVPCSMYCVLHHILGLLFNFLLHITHCMVCDCTACIVLSWYCLYCIYSS